MLLPLSANCLNYKLPRGANCKNSTPSFIFAWEQDCSIFDLKGNSVSPDQTDAMPCLPLRQPTSSSCLFGYVFKQWPGLLRFGDASSCRVFDNFEHARDSLPIKAESSMSKTRI